MSCNKTPPLKSIQLKVWKGGLPRRLGMFESQKLVSDLLSEKIQ